MENFAPPVKLEPLNRPLKWQFATPQPAAKPPAVRAARKPKPQHLNLREERERHGVSLEEIAETTRIPLRHLQELERGDVSDWPGGIYAKSWAREYAAEAGIDPDRVIAIVAPVADVEPSIDEIKQVREARDRAVPEGESPLAPLAQLTRKVAAVVVVLMLIALAALFFWRADSRPADQSGQPAAPVGTSGVSAPEPPR